MIKTKITREQLKIIYLAGGGFLFLLVFWIIIYAPQSRRIAAIKARLASTDAQIAQIQALSAGRDLTEVAKYLHIELRRAEGAIPSPAHDQDVLDNLVKEAKLFRIEVRNINFGEEIMLPDKIAGYSVQELPISLALAGGYRSLGEYLIALNRGFTNLVRVRQISIKGAGPGDAELEVNIELSAYLAIPNP